MARLPDGSRRALPASVIKGCSAALLEASLGDFTIPHHPSSAAIARVLDKLRALLFPPFFMEGALDHRNPAGSMEKLMTGVFKELSHEIIGAIHRGPCMNRGIGECKKNAERISLALISELPALRQMLELDLQEVLDRDPAAKTREEVMLAYPGFEALTAYRIAHFLHGQGVPLVPRIMTEILHRRTGIDLHPAARIEPSCSIDHGTGLIIGETSVIGRHVSLFHNVTLGSRSVSTALRGKKRHPTIGDNVIIYPGATILGDIIVGSGSVIGGNVFLLESCPPDTTILAEPPKTERKIRKPRAVIVTAETQRTQRNNEKKTK